MEQFDMLVCDKMEIDSVGTEEGYNITSDYNMELIEYYKSDTIFKILPTEIVLKIISFLDEDTVTVGRVCKYWNGLAFREIYDRGMAEMEVYQDNFKAIVEFTRAILINPSSPSPWFKRGVAHYKECEEKEAVRNITKALSLSPSTVEYYLMKAMLHQIQLQFDLAVIEATKAIELDPENGAAYYLRGYNRFDLQDYEGSIVDLTHCLQLPYPYKSKVLNCRGWCFNIRGELERALEDFTASGRLNVRYTKPFVNKAIVLSSRKDRPVIMQEEVILTEYLSQASDKSNLGAIYYTRAAIRQQWENYNSAISDYLEAVKEGYHSPHKAYVSIGWCYEKLNDFNKAIEFYNNAIHLKPTYSIAIEHRAGAKARTNNKTVDEDCKLAIKTNPKNLSFSFRYLAAVQADNNDYSLAIKTLSDGIKANPLDVDMLLNRAGYYTCQVDLVNAIKDYDTCLKHRPDTSDAWKYRANARYAAGDIQGAAHDYAAAIRLHSSPDITVWNNYAMALFCEGELEKACDTFSKTLAFPDSASFSIQLNQNLQLVQYVQEKRHLPKAFTPNFLVDPYFEMALSKKMKDSGKSRLCAVLKISEGHGISHLKQRVLGWKKRARVHM